MTLYDNADYVTSDEDGIHSGVLPSDAEGGRILVRGRAGGEISGADRGRDILLKHLRLQSGSKTRLHQVGNKFFHLYLYENNSMMYRWIADKLVGFVPVFELEDSILKPFLHSVLEYLEVVISECLEEDETDNKVRVITSNLKYIVVTFRFCICL